MVTAITVLNVERGKINDVAERAGVSITTVSYLSRTISIENTVYAYRKLKNACLLNTSGINRRDNGVNMASPERALLDLLYLNPDYYFDNLHVIDQEKLYSLLDLYQSKMLARTVKKLF